MLRLTLKRFLRQRGITETALADAIADALIASGTTVSERFLRYITHNDEVLTPDNPGKKPSLQILGFIILGLRHLTGEEVTVSDVIEYVADAEAAVLQQTAVLAGHHNQPPTRAERPASYELVLVQEDAEDDAFLDEVWVSTLQALKSKGYERFCDLPESSTPASQETAKKNHRKPSARRRFAPVVLLVLLVLSLGYIGYDHFILRPQLYERFTRLISFRDRVRPTSALAVPTLIGPEGEVDQLTPVLRISDVPGATAYEFYVENLVSNDGAYSGPVPNSSFPVPKDTLCPNTTYEWRARALGEDGWTSFSSPVQFTVSSAAAQTSPLDLMRLTAIRTRPETPTVLAPIGSTNTTTPTLQVALDPNVYGYGFYIRDLQSDKLVYDNNFVATNEIQVPEGVLKDGGVYQWNTRSRNCHYWSDFTPAQIFTVNVND